MTVELGSPFDVQEKHQKSTIQPADMKTMPFDDIGARHRIKEAMLVGPPAVPNDPHFNKAVINSIKGQRSYEHVISKHNVHSVSNSLQPTLKVIRSAMKHQPPVEQVGSGLTANNPALNLNRRSVE